MRTDVEISVGSGAPFHRDLLDGDLDKHFPGFSQGKTIYWGLAVGAVTNAWTEFSRVTGLDWEARLHLPNELKIPVAKRRSTTEGRITWRLVKQHCALFMLETPARSLNEARDTGRVAIRALVGLLRRELPSILPGDLIWEGGLVSAGGTRIRMTAVGLHLEPAEPKSSRMIHAETLKLARISLKDFPAHVQRALEWATLARSARIPSEKFTHLWLCILTLASHKQPKKMNDMPRIRAYVESMTYGTGGVLSHSRAENLASELSRFYDLRNDLLHRSDDSSLSSQLLDKLETVAYQLIDFELRKLSVALPAS